MSQKKTGLYQYPEYYDVLFKRDYHAEGQFLEACLHRHGSARDQSFAELGCGPARNAREFAQRGHRAVGLDLSADMLDFAREAAARDGVSIELVQGNLIDFDLARPVSIVACMWDTLLLIIRNEDMVRHLRAVSRNLLPGGVYVIETAHPRMFREPYSGVPFVGRIGDTEVEVTWGLPHDDFDCITQRHLATIRTIARHNGQVIAEAEERLAQRYYQVQELRALIELSGAFSEVHYYGTSALPFVPLSDQPECDGCIIVLVKAS